MVAGSEASNAFRAVRAARLASRLASTVDLILACSLGERAGGGILKY